MAPSPFIVGKYDDEKNSVTLSNGADIKEAAVHFKPKENRAVQMKQKKIQLLQAKNKNAD